MSKPVEMDPSVQEGAAKKHQNEPRSVYALDTLVEEVKALFPETTYEVSNFDGRNAAHDVQFQITSEADNAALPELLGLAIPASDPRVEEILLDAEDGLLLVSFYKNARVQDSREPFGLNDAWAILGEEDGSW